MADSTKGRAGAGRVSSVYAAVCGLVMVLVWVAPARSETWSIQTVDSWGTVGTHTSLALNPAGNPCICYREDNAFERVKYAEWNGSSWAIEPVGIPLVSYTGSCSLALDSAGKPHISLSGTPQSQVLRLLYLDHTGSTWSYDFPDPASGCGSYSSVATDSSDYAHISYYDTYNGDLKYAAWNGASWDVHTVDSDGLVGRYTSLALDSAENPHIAYHDYTYGNLKCAAWTGSAWDIRTVDSDGWVGLSACLALDEDDNPRISYYDADHGDLKYAAWTGSYWSIQTVDSDGDVGTDSSLALDADGNPHISYADFSNGNLKYAAWDGSSWTIQTVDSDGDVGYDSSLAIDPATGTAYISYSDRSHQDLKLAINENAVVPEPATLSLLTLGLGLLLRRRRD